MMRGWLGVAALLLLAGTFAGCGGDQARLASRANFTVALDEFLAQRGHLCLGKYEWPITVPADARSPDARQLPVLEKLGLVTGKNVRSPGGAVAREYSLTEEGQKYYLHEPVVIRTTTVNVTHPADFCVATLTRDRLLGWESPRTRDGRTTTSLLFTYHIAPAAWARSPEVRQAFPALQRAVEGEGTMQLRLGVHQEKYGWKADELDEK